ncbi:MAG: Hsp20/alpha crystallin family protein [Alphaproteobacteria bacterium]|nr:Hsp20/alpha crystallin family protein [Alphaproteobacteria bacterium]MCL2505774.1 Hsp20/alpha crystallin family protein [Alphaproteobacteria bacterium]
MKENMFLVPLSFDDMFDWRPSLVSEEFSDPFARMHRHMSRFLAAMDSELAAAGQRPPSRAMRMDAFIKDGKFKVITDMPGLAKDDIDVNIHDGMLTIKGEKKSEREDGNAGDSYYLNERSSVSFARTISLPEGINADKAEVEFKDGVLNISMPVKELPKPEVKKLTVK